MSGITRHFDSFSSQHHSKSFARMKTLSIVAIALLQALTLAAPVWEVIEERHSLPQGWVKHDVAPAPNDMLDVKVHLKQQNEELFEQKLVAVSLYTFMSD